MSRDILLWRYRAFLPVGPRTPLITLGEGFTPLVRASYLSEALGFELYLKCEGCNPTGSFKDRGMVLAMAKAMEEGSRGVMCASTGNTSASAAAYAARAGLPCFVLLPAGNVALGKLSQALAFGARVLAVRGNFDVALELARSLAKELNLTLVNSVNPYRLWGQRTAAFEVVDDLGDAPDALAIPVGNAGNISAYFAGFVQYMRASRSSKVPLLLGFQAEGAAPLVEGRPFDEPRTIATAIRIGRPVNAARARGAVRRAGGGFFSVSDEEILEAYRLLASKEGVFVEPASAASVAGLLKLKRTGMTPGGLRRVVAVLTGSGLKDPDLVSRLGFKAIEVEATREALLEAVGREVGVR